LTVSLSDLALFQILNEATPSTSRQTPFLHRANLWQWQPLYFSRHADTENSTARSTAKQPHHESHRLAVTKLTIFVSEEGKTFAKLVKEVPGPKLHTL